MPITIISVDEAKPLPWRSATGSPVRATKTYNETADIIRKGEIFGGAVAVQFSPEEMIEMGTKNPYPSLKYFLQKVIDQYGRKDWHIVLKKNRVTMYRNGTS